MNTITETKFIVTTFPHGFENKPVKEIGKIQNYFKACQLGIFKLRYLNHFELTQQVFKAGVPHMVGSWINSSNKKNEVKGYRTNLMVFDIDHLENLETKKVKCVEKKLKRLFHFVQESFSSSSDYSNKRYHCYLLVSELGDYDYAVYSYVYKRLKEDLSQELGVGFDDSQHLLKPIFASGKNYFENQALPIRDLKGYVDELEVKKRNLEQKMKKKVNTQTAVREISVHEFDENYKVHSVDYNKLLEAVVKLDVFEYESWIRILLSFADLRRKEYIDEQQVQQLCEAIDDGNETSYDKYLDLERRGYDGVTIGTLIYELSETEINTKEIFKIAENYKMKADREYEITGYLSENKTICDEIAKLIMESRGKRILLVGETGIGKSEFFMKLIEEIDDWRVQFEKATHEQTSAYCVMAIPRRNLIGNFEKKFKQAPCSEVITGSDQLMKYEREHLVQTAGKILTTPDHAPVLIKMEQDKEDRIKNNHLLTEDDRKACNSYTKLMLLDECHLLANDTNFKSETIEAYVKAEQSHMARGGVVVHVTATPETLSSRNYDWIIQIKQKDRKNVFQRAAYKVISAKDRNETDSKFLKLIRMAVRENSQRKLLIFVENKNLIQKFIDRLNNEGVQCIDVVAKREKDRGEEELTIIRDGRIPDKVQVIFATTALSAGVSIKAGFDESAETWIYCSSSSMNYDLCRIIQMSHRFRKQYAALKLFIKESDVEKQDHVFRYHTYVTNEIERAKKSIACVELLRKSANVGALDDIEKAAGLYTKEDGTCGVFIQKVESEAITAQIYNNYNNYLNLLCQLEEKFECKFINLDDQVKLKKSELIDQNILRKGGKEVISEIAKDGRLYSDMLYEAEHDIQDGVYEKVLSMLDDRTAKDLKFFVEKEESYVIVQKVMQAHLKESQTEKVCFVDDLNKLDDLNNLLNRPDMTVEKHLLKAIERKIAAEEKLAFTSSKALKKYIEETMKDELKKCGFDPVSTRFKASLVKKYLDIHVRTSNSKKIYEIKGLLSNNSINVKYNLENLPDALAKRSA